MTNDIYLELTDAIFRNTPIPLYIMLNDKFYLYHNGLKEVEVSDEFIKLYKSQSPLFTGRIDDKNVNFYCLRFKTGDYALALITPYEIIDESINLFVTTIFNNIVEYFYLKNREKEDIGTLKAEIDISRQKVVELEEKNSKIYKAFQSLSEEKVKLENIVNGQYVPLFVINFDYNIVYANDSLVRYLNLRDYKDILNKKCFNAIYQFDEPCKWCKMKEVINLQKQMSLNINTNINNTSYIFDQVMYPVILNGKVTEVVELLNDITEYMELITSIKKIDSEKSLISKKNVENIKEISLLKKTYEELYTEYGKAREQLDKLEILVGKLVEFNDVNKVLDVMGQLREVNSKNKILETTLENYVKKIKTYELRIAELSQKAIYGIDRLTNIIKNRKELSGTEFEKVLSFIEKQINTIKKEENYGD
jgi:PAS domain-containing protein